VPVPSPGQEQKGESEGEHNLAEWHLLGSATSQPRYGDCRRLPVSPTYHRSCCYSGSQCLPLPRLLTAFRALYGYRTGRCPRYSQSLKPCLPVSSAPGPPRALLQATLVASVPGYHSGVGWDAVGPHGTQGGSGGGTQASSHALMDPSPPLLLPVCPSAVPRLP